MPGYLAERLEIHFNYGACMREKLSTFAIELCQIIIVVFSGCHPNFIEHAMSACLAAHWHRLDSLVTMTSFVLTSATVLSPRPGVAHFTQKWMCALCPASTRVTLLFSSQIRVPENLANAAGARVARV